MKYAMGGCEFEAESAALTLHLRESNKISDDAAALRQRLEEDGYLLLRGLHDRDAVMRTRDSILRCLDARGALANDVTVTEGVVNPRYEGPADYSARHNDDLKTAELKALVYGPAIMGFFDWLFETPAASYQFQWPRAVGPGGFSPVHSDWPFMSRGSSRLLTCWTPLDDIPPEFGPLVICEGSHRWRHVIETYGQSDVDRDLTTGTFSEDPAELVERFGGRWATTRFRAGDVMILGMHTIHASLNNTTNRFRISCDTRYQPESEPMDGRWAGHDPTGHDHLWMPGVELEPVAVSRARWGV